MACSKYTLTNTGSTIVNFNYRRCSDFMWQYQVELKPHKPSDFTIAPSKLLSKMQAKVAILSSDRRK